MTGFITSPSIAPDDTGAAYATLTRRSMDGENATPQSCVTSLMMTSNTSLPWLEYVTDVLSSQRVPTVSVTRDRQTSRRAGDISSGRGCHQHPNGATECGTRESPAAQRSEQPGTEGAQRPCSMPRGRERSEVRGSSRGSGAYRNLPYAATMSSGRTERRFRLSTPKKGVSA